MMRKIGFIVTVLLLIFSPFWLPMVIEAQGTDDQAVAMVEQLDSSYTPWVSELVTLPTTWLEGMLFSVQITLGIVLLVWGLRRLRQNKDEEEDLGTEAIRSSQTS